MADYKQGERYRLRGLIGFNTIELGTFPTEEAGRAAFEHYKAICTEEKRPNPYCIFLVDWETEQVIAEYTELPKGFEDFPLTKHKA